MDIAAFEAKLRAEGYTEITTRHIESAMETPVHTHPFDASALIIEGRMQVVCDGQTYSCGAGDTFSLEAGREHLERYGEGGAKFIVGRRHKTAAAA